MLGKRSGQIDIFNSMIYEKLIPEDHLLVRIDSLMDFSFVYDIVKDNYSDIGRKSEDPVVLFKLNLLEYLYRLSDPAARVAHKSPGVTKKGYKDHIIVDEDSEIILASTQTPFNIGDEKEFVSLIEKVDENFKIVPKEISSDKAYGTNDNRGYLKDKKIISNIDFYDKSNVEYEKFDLRKFSVAEDLKSITCPNGVTSAKFFNDKDNAFRTFTFDKKSCTQCPLREQCLYEMI